ncbi:MAG: hypothetical protein NZV14_02710 [Bryobacteraceae bacterium]|nr:hypothetical protein [Bryobacteraceae bacterium]MDW8377044.1 hypothetical protein [Bryobacterales bacterium]
MTPLSIIAAEAEELAGLLDHLHQVRPLAWPLRYAIRAQLGELPVILAANGPGPELACQAARTVAEHFPSSLFLSTGFCGGLQPDLQVGEIVAASEIRGEDGQHYRARLPQTPLRSGLIYSSSRVACTHEEKDALRQTGALAVEMEAASIAKVAQQAGQPFCCIRVVSDAWNEDLPLDFNCYRDAKGRFDRKRIAMAAAMQPFHLLRPLLRFRNNCRRAAEKLGDFLASCRF